MSSLIEICKSAVWKIGQYWHLCSNLPAPSHGSPKYVDRDMQATLREGASSSSMLGSWQRKITVRRSMSSILSAAADLLYNSSPSTWSHDLINHSSSTVKWLNLIYYLQGFGGLTSSFSKYTMNICIAHCSQPAWGKSMSNSSILNHQIKRCFHKTVYYLLHSEKNGKIS